MLQRSLQHTSPPRQEEIHLQVHHKGQCLQRCSQSFRHSQCLQPYRNTSGTLLQQTEAYNSQGDTKANTPDQHPSATIQPRQHGTPKPTVTSPLLPIPSSQNTHNHKKQYITRPLSAINNTGPLPLLPKATISRPQHMACSKQWPALLPTPAHAQGHQPFQTATTHAITHI